MPFRSTGPIPDGWYAYPERKLMNLDQPNSSMPKRSRVVSLFSELINALLSEAGRFAGPEPLMVALVQRMELRNLHDYGSLRKRKKSRMASGLLQNLTRQSVMYHGECTY